MNIASPNAPGKTRRQPLWRWLFQFRLRTLLIVVTLAAVACWWYITPRTIRDKLSGGLLIRREVIEFDKLAPEERDDYRIAYHWGRMSDTTQLNVGAWQLEAITTSGPRSLVRGRFRKNKPHGPWTLYHANGQIAAEGMMYEGAKDGVWRTWSPEGRLLSEVTFEPRRIESTDWMAGMGGGGGLGGAGGMGGLAAPPAAVVDYVTLLQGPARSWHPNGQPRLDGRYENDARQGPWIFHDHNGTLIAQGSYERGRRVGTWKMRDAGNETYQDVEYRANRDP
jgi:antitoxin component YwqK of YwqJK toxin-antitoxin module